jgi:hypothetical protein
MRESSDLSLVGFNLCFLGRSSTAPPGRRKSDLFIQKLRQGFEYIVSIVIDLSEIFRKKLSP